MFNNLVESKPKKVRSRGGTIFSFIAHYGLILLVIYTSAQAATQDDGPKQEKVAFVAQKWRIVSPSRWNTFSIGLWNPSAVSPR